MLRRRSSALLRTTALAGLSAVALGIAALLVSLALMTGYQDAIQEGLLAAGGHLVAYAPPGRGEGNDVGRGERLAAREGIAAVGEVAYLAGLLVAPGGGDGVAVTVKGAGVTPPFATVTAVGTGGPLAVAVGGGVARKLGVTVGSVLSLQAAAESRPPRALPVRVGQVFSTGFSEVDETWVVVPLAELMSRLPGLTPLALEVWLEDPHALSQGRRAVEEAWGGPVLVSTWQERNPGFFAALRWQKLSLAVVLSLVLGVGAFEIASALVVLVTEKRHHIGVLMALGAEPGLVRRTLVLVGVWLGGAGVAVGGVLGIALVLLLRWLGVPHFPAEIAQVYMVDQIPLRLELWELGAVLALGVVEVVGAAWFPARRIARRQPVEVFRWV